MSAAARQAVLVAAVVCHIMWWCRCGPAAAAPAASGGGGGGWEEDADKDRPVWTGRALFRDFGYETLPCTLGRAHLPEGMDPRDQPIGIEPAECCACRAIVDHFEELLGKFIDVLPKLELERKVRTDFRLHSAGRKQDAVVPFARHMDLILHNVPHACYDVTLMLPIEETRLEEAKRVLESACNDLFEVFEEPISEAFYNNFSSQTDYLCGDEVTAACSDFYLEEKYEWVEEEVEEGYGAVEEGEEEERGGRGPVKVPIASFSFCRFSFRVHRIQRERVKSWK